MKPKTRVLTLGLCCFAILILASTITYPKWSRWLEDYLTTPDELLEKTPWAWSVDPKWKETAEENYAVRVDIEKRGWFDAQYTFFDTSPNTEDPNAARQVLVFKGNEETPYLWAEANLLVIAEYHPMSSGCALVGFDFKTGKEKWRASLTGVGPVAHSKYSNSVQIRQDHPRYVTVFGQETVGRYTEIVDLRTGKTVASRKEPPRPVRTTRTNFSSRNRSRPDGAW